MSALDRSQPQGFSLESYREQYATVTKGHAPPFDAALAQSKAEATEFVAQGLVFPGAHLLDVGCGHGRQSLALMDAGMGSYTGLDVVPESIEFCRRAFAGVPGFRFLHLDVKNQFYNPKGVQLPHEVTFPVESGSFDAVVAGSLFTHLGTRPVCERYLEEAVRVLKPEGRLFCSWYRSPPNKVSTSEVQTVLRESEILDLVTRRFHVYFCQGGVTDEMNNQWRLYGRLR
jgi:ubiquinone/menaquinone biosynthesis C-methylase UbiE